MGRSIQDCVAHYSAANGAQVIYTEPNDESGRHWRSRFDAIEKDRRFVLGERSSGSTIMGSGIVHSRECRLSDLDATLGQLSEFPYQMVMIPFPTHPSILDAPATVWVPKTIVQMKTALRSDLGLTRAFDLTHEWGALEWVDRVNHVKPLIKKVVLSRKSTFESDINPIDIAERVFDTEPNGYRIILETGHDSGIVSISPERLFMRSNTMVYTEAIAGTAAIEVSDELLASTKNRLEHNYVREWIVSQLQGVGLTPKIEETSLLRLSKIAHLRTPISAHNVSVGIGELISVLFPTPAVAGVPRSEAIEMINQIDSPRGMYTGLLGIVTPEYSEFVVLIRYCEWQGRQFSVRAGAGIVPESNPDKEWQELNQKVSLFGDAV
jgi:isochorismate synthase EntC